MCMFVSPSSGVAPSVVSPCPLFSVFLSLVCCQFSIQLVQLFLLLFSSCGEGNSGAVKCQFDSLQFMVLYRVSSCVCTVPSGRVPFGFSIYRLSVLDLIS